MNRRYGLGACLLMLLGALSAYGAAQWVQPTAAELKMTSDAAAPGAAAVILERRETVDETKHYHSVYERIKVLTAAGTRYGTVRIPWELTTVGKVKVEGRTVEPDGKVIPYAGTPERRYTTGPDGVKRVETVFTLPEVRAGSIVEYRWRVGLSAWWVQPPRWTLQQPLMMHKASYIFVQFPSNFGRVAGYLSQSMPGIGFEGWQVNSTESLPKNAQVKHYNDGSEVEIVERDVPALPREAFAPPGSRRKYWIDYYYSPQGTDVRGAWQKAGENWVRSVELHTQPTRKLKKAVAQMTTGSTTPEQKLRKIYAAAMTVENLSYQRRELEDSGAGGAKSAKKRRAPSGDWQWTSADVWARKEGYDWQIAELFIAMVRAAGMQADAMMVAGREHPPFREALPDWSQLTGEIAVVMVNGKRMFFDPEEPFCPFGELAWNHQETMGLLEVGKGAVPTMTLAGNYKDNEVLRNADLTVAANGAVTGTVRVTMVGAEAMRWRQEAMQYGEKMTAGDFDAALEKTLPAGVTAKTGRFGALTSGKQPLVAFVTVGGTIGELKAGGKLPSEFLMAREKQVFKAESRTAPVDLRWPYIDRDEVKLTLPAGYSVTGLPKSGEIPYPGHADAVAQYSVKGNVFESTRLVALGQTIYPADEYGPLRVFYRAMQERDVATVTVTKDGR